MADTIGGAEKALENIRRTIRIVEGRLMKPTGAAVQSLAALDRLLAEEERLMRLLEKDRATELDGPAEQ